MIHSSPKNSKNKIKRKEKKEIQQSTFFVVGLGVFPEENQDNGKLVID